MTLHLSLNCREYPWIEPLSREEVSPDGINLTIIDEYSSPERFTRLLDYAEFDLCELSMGTYLATLDNPGKYSVTAIPVFPHRRFRHSFLYTHVDSDITEPSDLNGGTIGLPNWQTTTGIWARGILQERHGLDLESITWTISGSEIVPLTYPSEMCFEHVPDDTFQGSSLTELERMLSRRDLNGVITPTEFRGTDVERVFDNPMEVEREYYAETGIFPIMHAIVVQDELMDEHPWIANKVYEAFVESLNRTMEKVEDPGWFKLSPMVWGVHSIERQLNAMGHNPWKYGYTEQNEETLTKLIDYAVDQGVISQRFPLEDLFVDNIGIDRFGSG